MHEITVFDDLTAQVLQEIGKFDLCSASIRRYKKTYDRLKEFAAAKGERSF